MANRDLLREAIADAKAVKEVAIANAKAALEEAFTPQLQSMLSEKISQLDEEEITEDDLAEVDKEKQNEAKEMEVEGKEGTTEAEEFQEEELEEDLDLEEILAELELEEGEAETMEEEKDPMEEAEAEMEEGMDDSMKEAEGDDDAELDLENMTEDELQGFIEDVIEDMIEDGELVPGPNADESEAEEAEDTDDGTEGDADVDIEIDDIDLQENEINEEELEEDFSTEMIPQIAQALGIAVPVVKALLPLAGGAAVASVAAATTKIQNLLKGAKGKKVAAAEGEELKEANATIKFLKTELNEVNLLNSKLLYTNKIFKAKNLTENQKIKVLKAFDKAETVKEAKVIFESLNENLVSKKTKSNIKESMGFASKPAGVAPKRPLTENVVEEDAMVSRFKKLAGLK